MPVAMLDKANSKCLNTNKELTTKVMRPSQTLNAIIDRLAG
jgi:monomeric isocitrate dehydrogenase